MADNDFLQGAQIGLGIAQQWAARSARQQELRVQESYRRMQERKMVMDAEQTIERTKLLKQEAQQGVDQQADFTKAQIEYSALVDVGVPPDQAYMQSVVPVMVKWRPKEAGAAVLDGLRIPMIEKANQALVEQREASARLSGARADEIETEAWLGPGTRSFAPSNTERIIKEADQRGIKFTPQELNEAFKVAAGVQPRERRATQELRGKFISEHLEKALEAEKESPTGKLSEGVFGHFRKPTPKSRDEVIEELGLVYDKIYGSVAATPAPGPVPVANAPATNAPAAKKLIFDPSTGSFTPAR